MQHFTVEMLAAIYFVSLSLEIRKFKEFASSFLKCNAKARATPDIKS